MPAGLKNAARYYLLRFWAYIVDMSGVAPIGRSDRESNAGDNTYIRPPDQFDEVEDYRMHSGTNIFH